MKPRLARNDPSARAGGFTMIEIALSLAIIGFALVAIIGILPYGMGVQRENTEETIINHDTTVLLDGICNGQQGLDDLTNYVACITNFQQVFDALGKPASITPTPRALWYTTTNSGIGSVVMAPEFPLTNGNRIVGLLTTPKYTTYISQGQMYYVSNHVVAVIRAMSGLASDKAPQLNDSVREMAFAYRVTSEVIPYGYGASNVFSGVITNANNFLYQDWTNFGAYTPGSVDWYARSNYLLYAKNLQMDLYDVRLVFLWPVTFTGIGSGQQSIRSVASGPIVASIQPGYPTVYPAGLPYQLYYVQPNVFLKAP